METSPCKDQRQGQDHKDQDKDLTHKDKDKDLKYVLKESLRTRTRINITANKNGTKRSRQSKERRECPEAAER